MNHDSTTTYALNINFININIIIITYYFDYFKQDKPKWEKQMLTVLPSSIIASSLQEK